MTLLAAGLLGLIAWWYWSRSGARGLVPGDLLSKAPGWVALALALICVLRGRLDFALVLGAGALWFLEGPAGIGRRLRGLFGKRSETGAVAFDAAGDGDRPGVEPEALRQLTDLGGHRRRTEHQDGRSRSGHRRGKTPSTQRADQIVRRRHRRRPVRLVQPILGRGHEVARIGGQRDDGEGRPAQVEHGVGARNRIREQPAGERRRRLGVGHEDRCVDVGVHRETVRVIRGDAVS